MKYPGWRSPMYKSALLALADGQVFHGISVGCEGYTSGEVVFNTAMTGYQEILTDPSYARQMITFTYPHIGNVGCNDEDQESYRVWASGAIIHDIPPLMSNWRSQMSLMDFFNKHGIIAIANIDTRRLTRILREKGSQNGCITSNTEAVEKAIEIAKSCPSLKGIDLVQEVSTKESYQWDKGSYQFLNQTDEPASVKPTCEPYHIVVYDFGVKHSILRLLVDRGCRVTVVPARTPVSEVLGYQPHGVCLSNGPGDPVACPYAIEVAQNLVEEGIPLLGICLGFQLVALACGAHSIKMKFGHHGANHPVASIGVSKGSPVSISSQNHGFAIDEKCFPDRLTVTHRSLFDGTLQGFVHKEKPVIGFQGHPEASPGPHDVRGIFDDFIRLIHKPKSGS